MNRENCYSIKSEYILTVQGLLSHNWHILFVIKCLWVKHWLPFLGICIIEHPRRIGVTSYGPWRLEGSSTLWSDPRSKCGRPWSMDLRVAYIIVTVSVVHAVGVWQFFWQELTKNARWEDQETSHHSEDEVYQGFPVRLQKTIVKHLSFIGLTWSWWIGLQAPQSSQAWNMTNTSLEWKELISLSPMEDCLYHLF